MNEPNRKSPDEILREIEELEAWRKEQEWKDRLEWTNMPARQTQKDLEAIIKNYSKRKAKSPLFVQFRTIIPLYDYKNTWQCWIEVTDDKGKPYDNVKIKASPAYVENVLWKDKSWKCLDASNSLSFYSKPLNNPVKEPTVKAPVSAKPKPARPKPKTGFLMDDLLDDNDQPADSLPWLESPVVVKSPEPTARTLLDLIRNDDSTDSMEWIRGSPKSMLRLKRHWGYLVEQLKQL